MIRKSIMLTAIVFALIFTSCVSKKKFLEMQDGRFKAEALSRKLNNENNEKAARIKVLIEDFETMKNELMESNAIKDHYIDSLRGAAFTLGENLKMQKESLQETSFNLDFEKQRLTDAIKNKDKRIGTLLATVNQLENTITEKNQVIDQKNFDIREAQNATKVMEGKVQDSESQLLELQSQLETVKSQTAKLQAEMKEKDATILRLENNVKLLKSQIGQ